MSVADSSLEFVLRGTKEAEAWFFLLALEPALGSAEGGNQAAGPYPLTSSVCRIGLDLRKECDHLEVRAHTNRSFGGAYLQSECQALATP